MGLTTGRSTHLRSHLDAPHGEVYKAGDMMTGLGFVTLDEPSWVPAAEATHVRDDDYVFGMLVGDAAYCLPFFIVDYYHTVNMWIGDEAAFFCSCDRCGSAGAWLSTLADGRTLSFGNDRIHNASLLLRDRETKSLWYHSDPVGLVGEMDGVELAPLGTGLHACYREWRTWHPGTLVLAEADDPLHRDPRHGHGRDEYFERRGLGGNEWPVFRRTFAGEPDTRLPEQEMVLGVNEPEGTKAYPWRRVKHEGNVVNDTLGDRPVTIWCDPAPNGFSTVAFDCRLDGVALAFEVRNGSIIDVETGSRWSLVGRALAGSLSGRQLRPLRSVFLRWHAWAAGHPGTDLFSGTGAGARQSRWGVADGVFAPLLAAFRDLGLEVSIDEELVRPALPQGCEQGLQVRLDRHRFWLYFTTTLEDAADLEVLAHDKGIRPRCLAHGRFVLKDEVEGQWRDWAHQDRVPDPEIPWSALLSSATFGDGFRAACDVVQPSAGRRPERPATSEILGGLEAQGRVIGPEPAWVVPTSGRPPGCDFVVECRVDGERLLVYRFGDRDCALQFAARVGHCLVVGAHVLRSTPANLYWLRVSEAAQRPDGVVSWSPLLDDESFRRQLACLTEGHLT